MKITFSINFRTSPGDAVFLLLDRKKIRMYPSGRCRDDWEAVAEVSPGTEIGYCFQIECGTSSPIPDLVMHEAGGKRHLTTGTGDISIKCSWQGYDNSAPLLSDPFTKIFFPHKCHPLTLEEGCGIFLTVTVPAVKTGDSILISGENPCLGRWNTSEALKMEPCGAGRWAAEIHIRETDKRLVFKFIMKRSNGEIVWEKGDNRVLDIPGTSCIFEFSSADFGQEPPRFAGTAVPVFSLRVRDGYGIGDFSCIKAAADWLHATGQHILQILPVNDTTANRTWDDSYPYNVISVMALNPIYINPALIRNAFKNTLRNAFAGDKCTEIEALESGLHDSDRLGYVDYENVAALKDKYIRILFGMYASETFATPDFKEFWGKNCGWLLPYAAFCTLRDEYATPDFNKWGEYSEYLPNLAEKMFSLARFHDRMQLHIFTQYHLHAQLSEAVSYAAGKGIAIMGDIPIGVNPHGVDTWCNPECFNMGFSAGAPPDYFSKDGQNWGFPTYDWDRMASDGYSWWKMRLKKMSEYFSMYRIDHILGFFRIWEIPRGVTSGMYGHFYPAMPYSGEELRSAGFLSGPETGTDGNALDGESLGEKTLDGLFIEDPRAKGFYHPLFNGPDTLAFKTLDDKIQKAYMRLHGDFFYRRHNGFWKKGAMLKLSGLVSATGMTACAEDLGMIPDCVPEVLDSLKIASFEIQRMPKNPAREFADPAGYPYLSVCSTGTHDVSTLRGWWKEDPEKTQRYYENVLCMPGKAPDECTPGICSAIIYAHLQSPSAFAVFPLQDWLATFRHPGPYTPGLYDSNGTPTPGRPDTNSTPGISDTSGINSTSGIHGTSGRDTMQTAIPYIPADEERINDPANPHHHWKYRMPVTLESLIEDTDNNLSIRKMIEDSGR